jgi:hypothetical protein
VPAFLADVGSVSLTDVFDAKLLACSQILVAHFESGDPALYRDFAPWAIAALLAAPGYELAVLAQGLDRAIRELARGQYDLERGLGMRGRGGQGTPSARRVRRRGWRGGPVRKPAFGPSP